MKFNKWTLGLAALGALSLTSVAKAEEKMSFVQTAVSGTTISGYVDTSIEWAICPAHSTFGVYGLGGSAGISSQANGFAGGSPLGIPFRNNKQDGFNLNVVELNISKPLDETPWASGYNVSLLFGPDAVGYNPSSGGAGGQFGGGLGGDFAIKDANIVLRVPVGNGLELKLGVFDTIIGYEVFEAGNNPNFSRSWGYAIEPTQHTGLLATYHINDNISVSAGVANTLMAGINTRNTSEGTGSYWDKTGLASITLTAPQSWGWMAGASFSAGIVYGFNGAASDAINVYAGITIPTPIKGLAFGAAFDYLTYDTSYSDVADVDNEDPYSICLSCCNNVSVKNGNSKRGGSCNSETIYNYSYSGKESVEAYSLALYGTWQATEKLSLAVRGEYVHGDYNDNGVQAKTKYRVSCCGVDECWTHYCDYSSHNRVDVYSLTGTLQYNLWANVISRAEIRYDQACYQDNGSQDQLSLYLNIIYKF